MMPLKLELTEGDIARVHADAIVNAANNHLWMGAGVAGAIKRAGGVEIEAEAVKRGPIEVGAVAVTGAGRLAARHVIHAAVMGQDLMPSAESIRDATRNALAAADELGLESIAFPALGTGVGGFALDRCAEIMIGVVRGFAAASLQKVIFVLYGQTAFEAFQACAKSEP
jgi:O-acetyl-ADP-ribose deacetylase (regulator of RNase III)